MKVTLATSVEFSLSSSVIASSHLCTYQRDPPPPPVTCPQHSVMVSLTLEFAGGAELLLPDKSKTHKVKVDVGTLGDLLAWIRDNLIKERPELFMTGASVRPGILVLINDADWELCGELEYQLEDGDNITFISTLHGG